MAPVICAGCGMRGLDLCPGCRAALRRVARGDSKPTCPTPAPDMMPRAWALTEYAGTVRQVIVAHKDEGRVAMATELACLWRAALAGAVADDPVLASAIVNRRVLVIPIPSRPASLRERGRDPWREVLKVALAPEPRLQLNPILAVRRRVVDQAGLSASERIVNLTGAMGARGRPDLTGWLCVLADDVLTTGATLSEAARVVRGLGAVDLRAIVIAATVRNGSQRHHMNNP